MVWRAAVARAALGALLLLALLAAPARAQTQPLVADLSKHLVAITTGFSGTDVLLFGATDGPGDIVLVVRGPPGREVVRRKDRAGIIWVNADSVDFEDVPAFYWLATSRPLDEFANPAVLERHQIGTGNLRLPVADFAEIPPQTRTDFARALVRLKTAEGLYGEEQGVVRQLANRLFRAELHFPSNVPVGTYMVEVYLIREGEVVSAEITPLIISKVGVGADIYDFAHNQPALYGIAAIIVAVAAGWLAGVAFRKS
ncbi:TIGR02186 family protein [Roseospirillum parvum]|uniref:Transmembrane protein (Alph_Pro_TM) n=1 Tax=Roseospirillum parvum TaxID=83401 RepID=A0A1G7TSU9_9PROT|nr:TIGR02186 family protein [Roseospirillum parvum]SDG38305.1 conserved hypothetical protein [Roseospirillum parvum]